jgi:hypothetical protein
VAHLSKTVAVLCVLLIACAAGLAVPYGLALRQRSRAEAFLKDFARLQIGESTLADAQEIVRKYGGIPVEAHADEQGYVFGFKFENKPLYYVPFVHHTELAADYYFRYLVSDDKRFQRGEHDLWYGTWRLNVLPDGIPLILDIRLGGMSSDAERSRAYAVNLSCLARLWGCDVPSAFYPPGRLMPVCLSAEEFTDRSFH